MKKLDEYRPGDWVKIREPLLGNILREPFDAQEKLLVTEHFMIGPKIGMDVDGEFRDTEPYFVLLVSLTGKTYWALEEQLVA